MKKEIKFRVWDRDLRKMAYDNFTISPKGELSFYWQNAGFHSANSFLMQYTGLKDKNGKEIYEGDWCRAEYRTREGIITVQGNIVFDEFMWCVDCKNDIFRINRLHNFEVIGNIYENPELLGKEVTK